MTEIEDFAGPFWEGLNRNEFRVPSCDDCGTVVFPPGPICPECGSDELTWGEIDPVGTLHSVTQQHRTPPGFDSPIVLGMIDLDAGPRLLSPIDAEYEQLSIGDRVRIEAVDYDFAFDRGPRADDPFFTAVVVDDV